MGQVGHFASADATRYPRGSQVVVRSVRGVELAEVLAPPSDRTESESDGTILRPLTVEDQLLAARLEKNRAAAYEACAARIAVLGLNAVLIDVEHLFDGQTLVFYFLGDPPDELQEVCAELAELYEASAQFRRFTETLLVGCGPGCGTSDAVGGGCGSCAVGCATGCGGCGTVH
jgi:cell fate regulator YaaT (PSP1 superfamily)